MTYSSKQPIGGIVDVTSPGRGGSVGVEWGRGAGLTNHSMGYPL